MVATLALLLLFARPALALTKDEAIERFTDAKRFYEAGEEATAAKNSAAAFGQFEKAAKEYEAILAAGYHNGQIFFNLGNVRYRLGCVGEAIANYRRAQLLMPRDADIASNLRQAKLLIQDKEIERKIPELVTLAFFWYFLLNVDELLLTTLLAYGILGTLLLIHIFWRKPWLKVVNIVLAIVFAVLAISLGAKYHREVVLEHGVLIAQEATVRYGNGTHYSVKFTVHEGADLIIQDEQPDDDGRLWTKALFFVDLKTQTQGEKTTAERRSGWLPAEAVMKLACPAPTPSPTRNTQP